MKSLVLSVVMFMVFFRTSQVSADLISETCKKTPSYNLCVSTLRSDSQSSTADVEGLARIAATKLQAKTTATMNQIKQLLKGTKNRRLKKALINCADAYNIVVKYDMPEALEAITKGDPKFAEDAAIDVAREADDCSKGGIRGSPVASNNKFVHDLSGVVLSIVRMLL